MPNSSQWISWIRFLELIERGRALDRNPKVSSWDFGNGIHPSIWDYARNKATSCEVSKLPIRCNPDSSATVLEKRMGHKKGAA